jgi:DNA-binding response OmpR family regulator
MYAEYFARHRWRTSVAQDGAGALAMALRERPSVIITELWLPQFDGLRLLSIVRSDAAITGVPVVVVTADTTRNAIDRAHSSGADMVLPKPCLPDFLFTSVARLVTGRDPAPDPAVTAQAPRREPMHATDIESQPPPELACPRCARRLKYDRSYWGGVALDREQWDYYSCPGGCGRFCYRRRTRKMRRVG